MSLFSAVEMAPRDPILGLNEQFAADPNPNKVNLGVGVYYDENGKLPLLACVAAAEQQLVEAAQAARLPAHRWHRRLRRGGAGAGVRRRQRRDQGQARGHGADPRWHRRPQGRRRLPQAPEPTGQGADQRPELGEPPRTVHQRRLRGRELPVLRRCPPRCGRYRLCGPARRARSGCQRQHRRAARLLPQPDRLRPDAGAVGRGGHRSSRHAAWCRSSTWPTKGSARA